MRQFGRALNAFEKGSTSCQQVPLVVRFAIRANRFSTMLPTPEPVSPFRHFFENSGAQARKQMDTAKLKTAYEDEGYVVLERFLDRDSLDQLRSVTDEIVAGASELTEHSDVLDLEESHRPDNPRVRRIKFPHRVHPFYRSLAEYPRLMSVLEVLIGPDIRLRIGGKINMKSAGYGAAVEWHQDWAYYPHTNQDVLAVGILLDDMNADNGPIMFLPGSHRGPIYDHHSQGAFCGAIDVVRTGMDVSNAREVYGPAGTVTIHHARLVHGSAPNRSSSTRRVLFNEYAAADAWPLAGVELLGNLDDFNERVVHGQPTLQPRLEEVPVRMPFPIAPFQGSLYENQRTLEHRYFDEIA